jgi:hypothetical protein
MIAMIGLQTSFLSKTLTKANCALNQIERTPSALYHGLTNYINTLYRISNPSNKETPLSQFIAQFLFLQIYISFITLWLFSSLADLANTNFFLEPVLAILLFIMLGACFYIFISLLKIKKNVQEWEGKFTKLESWAQDLEEDAPDRTVFGREDDQ